MDSSPPSSSDPTDSSEKSLNQKARSAFLWFASSTVAWQVVAWIVTLFVARILQPSDYGIFALLNTAVPYCVVISVFSLDSWIIQEEAFDERLQKSASTLLLTLGIVAAAVLWIAAPGLASFYGDPRLTDLYRLIAVVFPVRSIRTVAEALLRRELEFRPVSLIYLFVGVSRALLQLALAIQGHGYWALIIGFVYAEVVACVLFLVTAKPAIAICFDKEIFSRALRFGFYGTGGSIFWIAGTTLDDVAIGKFLGQEILGYYALAYMLTEMPLSKLNSVLSPILMPYYSKLREQVEELNRNFLQITKIITSVLGPVLLGVAATAADFMPLLFGEKWQPSVPMVQVLALMWMLRTIASTVSPLLLALNRPKYIFWYSAVSCLMVVPGFLILTPLYGINGVYATWLVLYPLGLTSLLYFLHRATGIGWRQFLRNFTAPIISAAVMFVAVIGFRQYVSGLWAELIGVIAEVLVGVIVYSAVLWSFFRDEVRNMIRTLRGVSGQNPV